MFDSQSELLIRTWADRQINAASHALWSAREGEARPAPVRCHAMGVVCSPWGGDFCGCKGRRSAKSKPWQRRFGHAGSAAQPLRRNGTCLKHHAHERKLCQRRGLLEIRCSEPGAIRAPPPSAARTLPINFSHLFSALPSLGHGWGCGPTESRMVVPKPSPVQPCVALHATKPMPATFVAARQANFRRKERRMTALAFTIDPFPAAWGRGPRGLRLQFLR